MITRKALIIASVLCFATTTGLSSGLDDKPLVIGIVGISGISEFLAIRAGAEDEAQDLNRNGTVRLTIDWRSTDSDLESEVKAVKGLRDAGVSAIVVCASDDEAIRKEITLTSLNGVPVVAYDGYEAIPDTLATIGTDNIKCGALLIDALADQIGKKGLIAIFGGRSDIPWLVKRVQGAQMEAKQYPEIRSAGVIYAPPTAEAVNEKVIVFQATRPDLNGWAMVVNWADFGRIAAEGLRNVKVAAVDPGVEASLDSVQEGKIQVLMVQSFYEWGHKSVEILYDKLVNGKSPSSNFVTTNVTQVTRENIKDYRNRWEEWIGKKK
jgi:ABC-type sugar transport system substrate-binding protein